MARLSKEEAKKREELILADFHTGFFNQRELSKKYDVSTATINKITKGLEPKNIDKVNAIVKAQTELNTQSEQEVNAVNSVIDEQTRRANLVYGATEQILKRVKDMADSNKKQVVVKVKEYSDGKTIGESIDTAKVELDPSDLKNLTEAADKASVTLGVNQRHSNQQINVNTQTNLQQNTTIELTEEEAKKKALDLGVPLSVLTSH